MREEGQYSGEAHFQPTYDERRRRGWARVRIRVRVRDIDIDISIGGRMIVMISSSSSSTELCESLALKKQPNGKLYQEVGLN